MDPPESEIFSTGESPGYQPEYFTPCSFRRLIPKNGDVLALPPLCKPPPKVQPIKFAFKTCVSASLLHIHINPSVFIPSRGVLKNILREMEC